MSTPEPIEIDGPVRLQSCTVDPVRRVVTWDDGRQMRLTATRRASPLKVILAG